MLLDFWTYGCVNCLHQLPEIAALEERLDGQPFVVIGVHSGNFYTEKDAQSVQAAIEIYEVEHPVAVDSDFELFDAYGAVAYPTTVLIDARGRYRERFGGEFDPITNIPGIVEDMIGEAQCAGIAAADPIDYRRDPREGDDSPLAFPSKVLALDDGRVVIADSTHHRIVVVDADGYVDDIFGNGQRGLVDGVGPVASFARPRGMAWLDDALYVADTENHVIRRIDLASREVTTVAGTGEKGDFRSYQVDEGWLDALTTGIRSPWDLQVADGELVVAMAGSHQLFSFDPKESRIRVLSGNAGEGMMDGAPGDATLAQPSGLAGDATAMYFVDAESSAVRRVDIGDGSVETLIGSGLTRSGDMDGVGNEVLFAHPQGIELLEDGNLVVVDTFNSKVKRMLPGSLEVSTLDWFTGELRLSQPQGASRHGDFLYVADTNNDRIVVRDLAADASRVFEIQDLSPPAFSASDR